MKKAILIFSLLVASYSIQAQNVVKDQNGNYTAVKATASKPIETGKTFTDAKGKVYPVYKTGTGKLFVIKTSAKTGNEYKMYLKEN